MQFYNWLFLPKEVISYYILERNFLTREKFLTLAEIFWSCKLKIISILYILLIFIDMSFFVKDLKYKICVFEVCRNITIDCETANWKQYCNFCYVICYRKNCKKFVIYRKLYIYIKYRHNSILTKCNINLIHSRFFF